LWCAIRRNRAAARHGRPRRRCARFRNITPIFLPSRAPELNPVENVWQYLRQNWLSNTVFENYDAIVDAACAAWRNLIAQPETITSVGLRDWAHIAHPL
jgi:transposase